MSNPRRRATPWVRVERLELYARGSGCQGRPAFPGTAPEIGPIEETQLRRLEIGGAQRGLRIGLELAVVPHDRGRPGSGFAVFDREAASQSRTAPTAAAESLPCRLMSCPAMSERIFFIPIAIGLHHLALLGAPRRRSEAAGAEEEAELERHVEARQIVDGIVLDPRDVMNAETAYLDQVIDPVVALQVIRVCFTLGASWLDLHRAPIAGIKRGENISILGARAECELPGDGVGRGRAGSWRSISGTTPPDLDCGTSSRSSRHSSMPTSASGSPHSRDAGYHTRAVDAPAMSERSVRSPDLRRAASAAGCPVRQPDRPPGRDRQTVRPQRGWSTIRATDGQARHASERYDEALVHFDGPRGMVGCPSISLARALPMPHKHNAARRHYIPKMSFNVQNRPTYEAGLRQRGSLTLWIGTER